MDGVRIKMWMRMRMDSNDGLMYYNSSVSFCDNCRIFQGIDILKRFNYMYVTQGP